MPMFVMEEKIEGAGWPLDGDLRLCVAWGTSKVALSVVVVVPSTVVEGELRERMCR
jgi:hypothetical protein